MTTILVMLEQRRATGAIGEGEVRAAGEIVRVALLGREMGGAAIPVMDLSRIRVDGGRLAAHRIYGQHVDPAVERWRAYVAEVATRSDKERVLGGRGVVDVLVDVLTGRSGWRTMDVRLKVRNGRTLGMVLRELRRYADLHNFST